MKKANFPMVAYFHGRVIVISYISYMINNILVLLSYLRGFLEKFIVLFLLFTASGSVPLSFFVFMSKVSACCTWSSGTQFEVILSLQN